MVRVLFLLVVASVLLLPIYLIFLKPAPPVPKLDLNEWWGPESGKDKEDVSIKPFKISFKNDMIEDLKARLKGSRRFTPPLEGIGFEYGFNSAQLSTWTQYWANEYKFREREQFFNQYKQYTTNIQGLNIHFIRVTPKVPEGKEVVPLLLLHGWPGSVREFYEAIPLLTAVSKDRDFAIELIVPSLPGYGMSDPAVRPGLGAPQVGVVMRNLMHRLGFKQFYLQGGDWGAIIGSAMVTLFPEEILGFHTNIAMVQTPVATFLEFMGSFWPSLIMDSALVDRIYPLSKRFSYLLEESGYMHLQATKPDTVGVALTDSPAGLLAYILEKFSTWTKPEFRAERNGGLEVRYTKDKLLDNLMMYWSSSSITTSMRLYSETFNSKYYAMKLDEIPTPVPTWVIQAKNEIAYQPPSIFKLKYKNVVNVTVLDDGGHFLAFELPEIFAEDVLKAVTEFRKRKASVKTEL